MAGNRTERLHVIGTAVLALVIVAVGWFLLISPQRAETDDYQSQTADAQLQNSTRQSRISQLDGEQKRWKTYSAALAAARSALPADTDMSAFLRQLQAGGAATGTTVSSVSVGALQAVTPPAAPVAAPSSGGSSAPAAAPAGPATTSGIFQIPISATVSGSNAAMSNFLNRLQTTLPRAVLVTEVTRGGDTATATGTMQLKLSVFVAPATAAVPTAPAGS